ncbi:hypothetical protein BJX61DRAFT_497518 [Aspergillus egyptiacus]|nr:hypothetical protein BJX61DRAFT_497518 [Aspergillus egyptiacus]
MPWPFPDSPGLCPNRLFSVYIPVLNSLRACDYVLCDASRVDGVSISLRCLFFGLPYICEIQLVLVLIGTAIWFLYI